MRLPQISFNTDTAQLIYAVFVIILIPVSLAFNTIYLLRSVQRDTDYQLNTKALLVEEIVAIQVRDMLASGSAKLVSHLKELTNQSAEIRAIEVYQISGEELKPIVTTSSNTRSVADPVLNQLAWGSNQAYSKQILAKLGHGPKERVWLVAAPISDSNNKKIGLINLYLSAYQIDAISDRTTRDSAFILLITMVMILLLLVNHFRFFETSILFKKLSEVDQLKDDFVSMASHELKTPLTAVAGYAYLMFRNPAVKASRQLTKQLSVILQSTERLKNIVDEILDVSRIEQRRLRLNMVHNDVRSVIGSVVYELLPLAQQKRVKLIYFRPRYPLLVLSDLAKLRQIFYNLVSNGIKYTPYGGVTIYHDIKGQTLRTFVKDTGIGIAAEDRPKLFNKFSRIYNDKTKNIYGTGLGLWITKQLVEKMGGTIWVDSIEHQGSQFVTSFSFKLPKVSRQASKRGEQLVQAPSDEKE